MIVLDEEVARAHLEDYEMPVTTLERIKRSLEVVGSLANVEPPHYVFIVQA